MTLEISDSLLALTALAALTGAGHTLAGPERGGTGAADGVGGRSTGGREEGEMILLCGIPSESPLAMLREQLLKLGVPTVVFNQRRFADTRLEDLEPCASGAP